MKIGKSIFYRNQKYVSEIMEVEFTPLGILITFNRELHISKTISAV